MGCCCCCQRPRCKSCGGKSTHRPWCTISPPPPPPIPMAPIAEPVTPIKPIVTPSQRSITPPLPATHCADCGEKEPSHTRACPVLAPPAFPRPADAGTSRVVTDQSMEVMRRVSDEREATWGLPGPARPEPAHHDEPPPAYSEGRRRRPVTPTYSDDGK